MWNLPIPGSRPLGGPRHASGSSPLHLLFRLPLHCLEVDPTTGRLRQEAFEERIEIGRLAE